MARPGIEPRTSDLRVRCPADCATLLGSFNVKGYMHSSIFSVIFTKGTNFATLDNEILSRRGLYLQKKNGSQGIHYLK